MTGYLLVLFVGVAAGTLSGIVGTGSSMMLMPVLVICFGPQRAVPIMAIGAVMGNLGKVCAWRREIDWRALGAYCLTAVPGVALGVRTLLALPARFVDVALGVFFIAMIPARRWLARRSARLSLWNLAMIGGPVGFLTGIVVSTGPITVPVFTSYGLERGAFLATEAAGALAVYATKIATFREAGALPLDVWTKGLIVGGALMTGSFIAKRFVVRMKSSSFRLLVDGLMFVSGTSLLWASVAK
ncbi:membrane protein [Burkholderia sp. MSh2]|uniref:Probable membrane transporter protein n=1 Tax=Burkholderia paludis TaxID=1506587 RepID=A0A6P2PEI4_9BURK|nr:MULTISPECIES: sulfite exporter TauE/SafE family protein [Burkholderia]KEZ02273.1 membrane protein [Burkholderia sp. MSh2]CAB3760109.1 hypothetical protein LMG30113_03609 [Burkholderia paludis]VWC05842.1 hypothetical protein BPA30113_04975 [Burkholderia paludis]